MHLWALSSAKVEAVDLCVVHVAGAHYQALLYTINKPQ